MKSRYVIAKRVFALLLFAILVTLLCCCGSYRKTSKLDIEEVATEESSEDLSIVSGTNISIAELASSENIYDIDFNLYDTSKPIDQLTGKPPKIADGTIKGKSTKDSKSYIDKNDSLKLSARSNNTINTSYTDKSESVVEREETTIPEQLGLLCAGFCLLYIVIWLLHKRFQ